MAEQVHILSLNVRGFRDTSKITKTLNWAFEKKKIDIFLIQESHGEPKIMEVWKDLWKGKIYYSHGSSNSKGVAIFVKQDLDFEYISESKDEEGRYIMVKCKIYDMVYIIVNYYGPNKDDLENMSIMLKKVEEYEESNLVIGGDFNFVMNIDLDKSGGLPVTHFKMRDYLVTWMEDKGLVDIWRVEHPSTRQYTWRSNTKPRVQCRLDYFIISETITGNIKRNKILPGFMSDHSGININLATTKTKKGKGFWKFNNELLLNEIFVLEMREMLKEFGDLQGTCGAMLKWDTLKCVIRGICLKHGFRQAKERRLQVQLLEKKQSKLDLDIGINSKDEKKMEDLIRQKEELNYKLEQIIESETKGAAMRSKCDHYEHGEKSSKFFLGLEKHNGAKKHIKMLIDHNGFEVTDHVKILAED